MSVNVNLSFTVTRLDDELAPAVREAIQRVLVASSLDGDVYDIEGIKYKEGYARLLFGNDWSRPLSISGVKATLEKLESDLRAAISEHQPDYGFELVTRFPDDA